MKRPLLFILALAPVLAACAPEPVGSRADAPTLEVLALEVDENLDAGDPYPATLTYRVEGEGEIRVRETCFTWSGEGPYCFDGFRHDREAREITTHLTTRNPNRYLLSGSVRYLANGHRKQSNAASAPINVE